MLFKTESSEGQLLLFAVARDLHRAAQHGARREPRESGYLREDDVTGSIFRRLRFLYIISSNITPVLHISV